MARGRQAPALTTITLAAASDFLRKAEINQQLGCKAIPGFFLIKLNNGGAWKHRYTDATGSRRTSKVGMYAALKPEMAAYFLF